MKLWQKIFLLTLALVIAVVNVTSLVLLSNNHALAIEREQQEALSRHNYIVVEMQNRIIYRQLVDRIVTLSEDDALQVARDVLIRQRSDSSLSLSLFHNAEPLYSVNQTEALIGAEASLLGKPDFSSLITEVDGLTYLLLTSTIMLNNTPYQLISSFDITTTYELFESDLDLVRIISIVSGLIVAGILLALTRGLLGPLHNLSTTTHRIAEGDLNTRATIKGHDEVSEVARNFNVMADSIELNVTALQNLAEARRVFIGNLAHEMKTPLTSILGFADLLRIKRSVSDEERQEYADIIVGETKHLQSLSGKLMELLTLQNVQLSFDTIESVDFSERLKRSFDPLLKREGISLVVETDAFVFSADRELITSLIYNLIDNALKASSPESTVQLLIKESEQESKGFSITVIDEGVGIPANEISLLTEPFYMLDKARTRKHGGAGLGLALCVEIAQVHKASFTIESELGKGTQVQVLFPESALILGALPEKTESEEVSHV